MKHGTLLKLSVFAVTSLGTLLALTHMAAAQPASAIKLDPSKEESLNRFGISFGLSFNTTVDFGRLGAVAIPGASRLTPDGDRFNYDDGYVLTDSTGNLLGLTRYWGYDSSSQYDSAHGTITMNSSSATTPAASRSIGSSSSNRTSGSCAPWRASPRPTCTGWRG